MNFTQLDKHLHKLNEKELNIQKLINTYGKKRAKSEIKKLFSNEKDINNWIINSDCLMEKDKIITVHKHDRFIDFEEHKHDFIELFYIYSGSIINYINDKEIVLKQGEILLLDMNVSHSIKAAGENDIGINILIKEDFFDTVMLGQLSDNDIISDFISKAIYGKKIYSQYIHFKSSNNDKVQSIIKSVLCEMYDPDFCSSKAIEAYMLLLFTELFRDYKNGLDNIGNMNLNKLIVGEIYNYLHKNYKDTNIKKAAKHFNFSHDYFGKMVKQASGKSFTTILQNIRLKQACILLKNTKKPITSIVSDVGYSNLSYFYKIFKTCYNVTPDEYRYNSK